MSWPHQDPASHQSSGYGERCFVKNVHVPWDPSCLLSCQNFPPKPPGDRGLRRGRSSPEGLKGESPGGGWEPGRPEGNSSPVPKPDVRTLPLQGHQGPGGPHRRLHASAAPPAFPPNVFLVSLKMDKQDLIAGNESRFFPPPLMLFGSTQTPVILLLYK